MRKVEMNENNILSFPTYKGLKLWVLKTFFPKLYQSYLEIKIVQQQWFREIISNGYIGSMWGASFYESALIKDNQIGVVEHPIKNWTS